MKYAILERIYPLTFLFLKHLQTIDSSIVTITKPLSDKIGETICKGLKRVCKLFEKNGQKDLKKSVIFSKISRHFILELALGNSYRFCLASFLESRILSLVVGKNFKVTMPRRFAL